MGLTAGASAPEELVQEVIAADRHLPRGRAGSGRDGGRKDGVQAAQTADRLMAVYTQLGAEELAALIAEFRRRRAALGQGHRRGCVEQQLADRNRRAGWCHGFRGGTLHPDDVRIPDRHHRIAVLPRAARSPCRTSTARCRARSMIASGASFRMIDGKAVALIEFLPGVSVSKPTPAQARCSRRGAGAAASGRRRFSADPRQWHGPGRMACGWPANARPAGLPGLIATCPADRR